MADDKITIMIDSAKQTVPHYNEAIRCPDHPTARVEQGFGLAGGGYGVYTVCSECAVVLSKTQEDEE